MTGLGLADLGLADLGLADLGLAGIVAVLLLRQAVLVGLAGGRHAARGAHIPSGTDVSAGPEEAAAPPGIASPGVVDVVIPAYDEERTLEATVRAALASDVPVRVIVVDDGSSDGTLHIARALASRLEGVVVLAHDRNRGKAAALETGLAAARSAHVATLDADTLPESTAIRRLLAAMDAPEIAAAACNVRVAGRSPAHGGSRSWLVRWQHLEYVAAIHLGRRAQARVGALATVPGALAVWRVASVRGVGGFSGETVAEDTDLTLTLQRAGHRVRFVEDAAAWTHVPDTLGALVAQRRRWLLGNLQCAWRHRRAFLEPGPLRRLALPDLWWTHLGVYLLLPLSLVWLPLSTLSVPTMLALGTGLLALDLAVCTLALHVDGQPLRAIWDAPAWRLLFPFLMWSVFAFVAWRLLGAALTGERPQLAWRRRPAGSSGAGELLRQPSPGVGTGAGRTATASTTEPSPNVATM